MNNTPPDAKPIYEVYKTVAGKIEITQHKDLAGAKRYAELAEKNLKVASIIYERKAVWTNAARSYGLKGFDYD